MLGKVNAVSSTSLQSMMVDSTRTANAIPAGAPITESANVKQPKKVAQFKGAAESVADKTLGGKTQAQSKPAPKEEKKVDSQVEEKAPQQQQEKVPAAMPAMSTERAESFARQIHGHHAHSADKGRMSRPEDKREGWKNAAHDQESFKGHNQRKTQNQGVPPKMFGKEDPILSAVSQVIGAEKRNDHVMMT